MSSTDNDKLEICNEVFILQVKTASNMFYLAYSFFFLILFFSIKVVKSCSAFLVYLFFGTYFLQAPPFEKTHGL